jgi:hypothetical protein
MHIIHLLFYFLNNIKIYHWNTKSFARHKASDDCFIHIQNTFDKFIETYIGKYGRNKLFLHKKQLQILKNVDSLTVFTDKEIKALIEQLIDFLKNLESELNINPTGDSDLLNLRDEMLVILNQTLYLFTLD